MHVLGNNLSRNAVYTCLFGSMLSSCLFRNLCVLSLWTVGFQGLRPVPGHLQY
ncbi:hypothetical protein HanIR_Chr16g0803301 [Helianthus annuus]|nr:hypothetical protein HanIR_Chr16g0803301 [Helianthus annuus]